MRHRHVEPNPKHAAFLEELKATLASAGKDIESDELLAITSQFLGMLLALQDQRRHTVASCMAIIDENIAIGNQAVIADRLGQPEGRA